MSLVVEGAGGESLCGGQGIRTSQQLGCGYSFSISLSGGGEPPRTLLPLPCLPGCDLPVRGSWGWGEVHTGPGDILKLVLSSDLC